MCERMRQKWSMPSSISRVRRAAWADDGAGLLEQRGPRLHGGAHFGLHRQAAAGVQQQANAQAAQAFRPGSKPRQAMSWAAGSCCRARRAGQHLHHQRGVLPLRVMGPAARPV
jgi:hypothetical protein